MSKKNTNAVKQKEGTGKKKGHGKGSPHIEIVKKALEIFETGKICFLKNNRFKVPSQSEDDKYYEVCYLDVWRCTCPYNQNGHGDCKHIMAAQMYVVKDPPKVTPKTFVIKKPEPQCVNPDCKGMDCVFYDTRDKKVGTSTRYRCRDCGKRFVYNPFFLGLHYPPDIVTSAIDDSIGGKSLKKTSRGLEKRSYACMNRKISRNTIWRWTKRAQNTTKDLSIHLPIRVSNTWHADEICVKSKGEELCMDGVLCAATRYMIAIDFSWGKAGYDATELFEDAVDAAGIVPDVLITDKHDGFSKGHTNSMKSKKPGRTPCNQPVAVPYHIRSVTLNNRHIHNNKYESHNGHYRDRAVPARGFASKDPPLLGLSVTYYNFILPHDALNGKTPAEAMGFRIEGYDKWYTLLQYAAAMC